MNKEVLRVVPGQIWQDLERRNGRPLCKVQIVKNGKAFLQRCREDGTVTIEAPVTALTDQMRDPAWVLVRDN